MVTTALTPQLWPTMVRLLFYIHDKEGMVIPTHISIKLRSRILTKLEQKKT